MKNDQSAFEFINKEIPFEPEKGKDITVEIWRARSPSFTIDDFINTILKNGINTAVEKLEKFLAEYPEEKFFDESLTNQVGYRFLYFYKNLKDAIGIFKLNAKYYPESFNVYDSLGEGLIANGEVEEAIKNYKKSLELNPQNDNAKKILEDLENKR